MPRNIALRYQASSLSDLKNRSENLAGREQILTVLQVNSHSIDQKSGEIWVGQADLQPISFKSDRLLDTTPDHQWREHCQNMVHQNDRQALVWCARSIYGEFRLFYNQTPEFICARKTRSRLSTCRGENSFSARAAQRLSGS